MRMSMQELIEREAGRDRQLEKELAARGIVITGDVQSDSPSRSDHCGHIARYSIRMSETVAGGRGCRF